MLAQARYEPERPRRILGSAFDLIFLRLSGTVTVDVHDLWTGAVQPTGTHNRLVAGKEEKQKALLTDSSCKPDCPVHDHAAKYGS
ncbi:MAG: hypothetical protein M1376_08005 [Planctomycetes bacterium]|nr:hypothetical protein [Planctomycetota bacterium]